MYFGVNLKLNIRNYKSTIVPNSITMLFATSTVVMKKHFMVVYFNHGQKFA